MVIPDYLWVSMIVDDYLGTVAENHGLEDMAQQGLDGAEQCDQTDKLITKKHQPST